MGRPLNNRFFLTGSTTTTTTLLVHSRLVGSGTYSSTILKQKASKKFKVQQAEGPEDIGVAYLVPTDALELNQAYMTATDTTNATYFVSKISGHRATITQWTESDGGSASPPATGWVFITGASVPWTTTTPPPAGYVSIESA